jgi:hypothetical protein
MKERLIVKRIFERFGFAVREDGSQVYLHSGQIKRHGLYIGMEIFGVVLEAPQPGKRPTIDDESIDVMP